MNQASQNRADEIEALFRAHEGGDFCLSPSSSSSVCVGDATDARTIVYTTKYQCVPRMKGLSRLQKPIAIIGRYGLPVNDDLSLVRGSSQAPIFIGDCDPPDILLFAWLREHLPIVWHGVNDEFLIRHGTRNYEWIRISLSDAERKTVPNLSRLCPDYREFVGEYCSSLIENGFKIELEGAIIDRDIQAQT